MTSAMPRWNRSRHGHFQRLKRVHTLLFPIDPEASMNPDDHISVADQRSLVANGSPISSLGLPQVSEMGAALKRKLDQEEGSEFAGHAKGIVALRCAASVLGAGLRRRRLLLRLSGDVQRWASRVDLAGRSAAKRSAVMQMRCASGRLTVAACGASAAQPKRCAKHSLRLFQTISWRPRDVRICFQERSADETASAGGRERGLFLMSAPAAGRAPLSARPKVSLSL